MHQSPIEIMILADSSHNDVTLVHPPVVFASKRLEKVTAEVDVIWNKDPAGEPCMDEILAILSLSYLCSICSWL